MNKEHKDPYEIDLNAPRLAWYKQKTWKKHSDTVYWVDIKLAQQKDSEVAGGSEDSNESDQNQKLNYQERRDLWMDNHSSQGCVPMSVERVDKDEDARENVDADQTRTERPVSGQPTGSFTQLKERDIDFRVSGLPHAVVKEAETLRVLELVKKIESHPHREALQVDLQQNNISNPLSKNSKAMIREMGNVELIEMCETIPKVQCSQCLLYWNQGLVYCTCGHFLVESESRRKNKDWILSLSRTT